MNSFLLKIKYFLTGILVILAFGCNDDNDDDNPPPEEVRQVYLLGMTLTDDNNNFDKIKYYIGDKSVTLENKVDVGIPMEYSMNFLNNDTIIFIHGISFAYETRTHTALKNGVEYSVTDNTPQALVYSVYVSGNDIYAVGQYMDSNNKLKACYWKNRANRVDLPCDKDACAVKMIIDEGIVYVTGYYVTGEYESIPCYWKDGSRVDLSTGISPQAVTEYKKWEAHSIAVDNGNVYVSGKISYITVDYQDEDHWSRTTTTGCCYWKNGQLSVIDGMCYVNVPLTVHQGKTYIPGAYITNPEAEPRDKVYEACYFEDGIKKALSHSEANIELAISLCFDEKDMYITGTNLSSGIPESALWKNNEQTVLDSDFIPLGQMFVK